MKILAQALKVVLIQIILPLRYSIGPTNALEVRAGP